MAAITTIERDSIMHWLMPAIIEGIAMGICTLVSFCQPVDPKASATSFISGGTCLMPRFVSLTTGGMANMTVATTPGTTPNPKNMTAGIR